MRNNLQLSVRADGTLAVRADGTPDTPYAPIYGPGGLFGVCGDDPTLFNATIGPIGVERILTWVGSVETDPTYSALTGISSSGYSQSGKCTDCGTPDFTVCRQSACFGRICQQTYEHAVDDLGLFTNKGVPRKALFGDITLPDGTVLVAQGQPIMDAFTLELIGAGYNVRTLLADLIWNGDPANNVGGYMEFPGLLRIINTGKLDVFSGLLCPALDSYIMSYGNAVIGQAGSPSILAYMAGLVRSVRYRISGINKNPDAAQMYFVMHPRLWDQVAQAVACEYGLVCPQDGAASTQNDAMAIADFRDDMLNNYYVRIDGRRIPVVLDNVMPSTPGYFGSQTMFCGQIALLTTEVEGETILWGEYQDFDVTMGPELAWFRRMFGAQPWAVTDGGRFYYAYEVSGGTCFDAKVIAKPRLKCTMPQLQGRITGVCAVPLGTYPSYTGSGDIYERAGGASTSPTATLYGECASIYD
jgi:hypothetical protein